MPGHQAFGVEAQLALWEVYLEDEVDRADRCIAAITGTPVAWARRNFMGGLLRCWQRSGVDLRPNALCDSLAHAPLETSAPPRMGTMIAKIDSPHSRAFT